MGLKGSACTIVVMLVLTGIGSQKLDLGDSSVLTKYNIKNPDDVKQIADWGERCRLNVGQDAVDDIKESFSNLTLCIGQHINMNKLRHEINSSIPRGELDLVFKKYCGRRDPLMGCVEDASAKIERCASEPEQRDLSIIMKAIHAGIDFVCHNDGDRIALFMAEMGEDCIKNQMDNITECIKEEVPEIKDAAKNHMKSYENFALDEENCKKVNSMHHCVVKNTMKCSDPTPSNILDSLITQVLKVTPCWQTSSAYQGTGMSPTQYLLPHVLTLLAAALTAANILL
ncbi:27 kDa glycoprotein-like [Homarus americanus]|uniref:27 kDa glycoprotein-like n=1 Tax=Homarus americanus TaxID=6706 RepID=UPI001C4464F8|nr:27 kDa glycoprotein-like [Homarus americanus]